MNIISVDSEIRMTDFALDPEFLRIYHSADKEWPGYKDQDRQNTSLPLLISEIFRLIPYIGSEYVRFHPKNMADVTIDRVELIGIVTDKTRMMKYTSYTVDDSTGAIPVLCANKPANKGHPTTSHGSSGEESSVYTKAKSELNPPFGLPPGAPYSYERHIQNLWHRARDEEPLYNEIALYDYVHVIGFCAMSFRNRKDIRELTDEDIELGRLFFFGINLRRISETEHNAMMKSLITEVAWKRYMKPNV